MPEFKGFPKELPRFFKQLKKSNTKDWFQENKKAYETYVKTPSQEFVSAMGERLSAVCPGINAIPKVNKSLFRLNRDIRFSSDKSPYKTNMGILFWDGPGKRMESSGFYFHVEDQRFMLGSGMYMFSKPHLEKYRLAVTDKKKGAALKNAIEALRSNGYEIGTRHYKRVPRGFTAASEFETEYLRYNGLSAKVEIDLPDLFFTPGIVDFAFDHYAAMMPLHRWLTTYISEGL